MSLPRILFAWEAGENFGHVSKIAEVARSLTGRAEVLAAVRNPIALRQIAPDLPVTVLPAPAAPPQAPTAGDDAGRSYPDVLRHIGWSSPQTLGPLVEAWRNMFALARPDVLVVQAAPTALLAARRSFAGSSPIAGPSRAIWRRSTISAFPSLSRWGGSFLEKPRSMIFSPAHC